ncbi:MAG: phosphatidylglycerophosphatase A [Chloroflexi bacterium]|nr:phosphatidylglycerophosphatase A [Chloroflexota bacterium]
MRRVPVELVATGLGSGLWPIAPATAGSAAALLLYWALPFAGTGDSPWFFAMIGVTALAGVWAAEKAGTRADPDPKRVVIDEWVGVWVTVAFLPATWGWLLAGFFLFRVLDILKPLGIRRLEQVHGGLGVMLDDVAAGVLGAVVLNAIRLIFF